MQETYIVVDFELLHIMPPVLARPLRCNIFVVIAIVSLIAL